MSDAPPKPTNSWRSRLSVEPVLIGIGLLVLLMVSYRVLVAPRAGYEASDGPAQRLAALERQVGALANLREADPGREAAPGREADSGLARQVAVLETRLDALESRPAPADPAPRLQALEQRPAPPDMTPRLAPLEARLQTLEQRPAAAEATRLEALATSVETQAKAQAEQASQTKALADQAGQIKAQAEQAGQAANTLRAALAELAPRLAALEQAQRDTQALEGRLARLAGLDQLRAALAAGQPLGAALARLPEPDPALARFAITPPPTESALRLSFEAAADQARAAADTAPRNDGVRPGVVDAALSRLSGLVTIRRGETVVWGDAAEAEIERARRALEAGDLDAALSQLDKLPPSARDAMRDWTGQARALLAARASLRRLAAG